MTTDRMPRSSSSTDPVSRPVAGIPAATATFHEPAGQPGYHASYFDWRAVIAGGAIALFAYGIFMALGLAVGGANLQGAIQGPDTARGLGTGAAIWITVSMIASVFIGAYVAGRIGVRKFVEARLGWIHGAVVAALFFLVAFAQVASVTGMIARGVGDAASAAGTGTAELLRNGDVQDVIERSLGGLNLKSDPETVAKGVAVRMLRDNPAAATNYLAYQAGISNADANARLNTLRGEVQSTVREAGIQASRAMKVLGYTVFGAMLLGTLLAMWAGMIGARVQIAEADRAYGPVVPTASGGRA